MGVPSVVKIKKGNVEYTGRVDIAKYTMKELTRRAMTDVGRYILANVRMQLRAVFPFTKAGKNSQRYQIWVRKKEGDLFVGAENIKKGAKTAWWADQLELDKFTPTHTGGQKPGVKRGPYQKREGKTVGKTLGTFRYPRRHIMETFVKGHISKIVEIESQYLEYMNDENAAMAAIAPTAEKEIQE